MTNTLKVLIYEQVLFLETHQQEKERRILGIYLYEVPASRGSPTRLGLPTQNMLQQKLTILWSAGWVPAPPAVREGTVARLSHSHPTKVAAISQPHVSFT